MPDVDRRLLMPKALTARVIGISVQAFANWGLHAHERKGREALYYLPDVVAELLRRRMPESAGDLVLDEERARLAKEQADKIALDNAVSRGELIDVATLRSVWQNIFTSLRQRMLALPTKKAAELAPITDANRIRSVLADEVREILSEAAAYQPGSDVDSSVQAGEGSAVDPAPAAEADGERMGGRQPKTKPGKQRGAGSVAN